MLTFARNMGIAAEYRTETGVDVVDTAVELCVEIAREYPDSTVYTGQIVFRNEHPLQKVLHNETAFAIQRRLQYRVLQLLFFPSVPSLIRRKIWERRKRTEREKTKGVLF